jgi:hypothetical protein
LNLLANITDAIFNHKVKVHLNLSECPNITASALVMLFAEISRAKMVFEDDDIITIDLPKEKPDHVWNEAVTLSYRNYSSLFDNDHTFQTMSEPNKAIASILKLLLNSGVELSRTETRVFTKGVNEAMLNVINHAYHDQDAPLDGIGRRWWQACWVAKNKDKQTLVYIIYDLGCGMLASLPKENNESISDHITRVMSYGVSRTQEADRGKGTKNIEDATDIRDNSRMFIGTNSAVYIKTEGQSATAEPTFLPFGGTLIEWQIFL